MSELIENRIRRAQALCMHQTLRSAVESGALEPVQDISLSEAVVLGLVNQGVRHFIGIFGHGTTDVGEVLRIYEQEGVVRTANVRNEIEASHAASMLKWKYGRTAAVFTSIGPGAMQAAAASLVPLSNGLGVYYLMGDETTESEGPNMQQIPRREQELFLRLFSVLGPAYTLHTPAAVFTALKRGDAVVNGRQKHTPFYMLLPMNTQPLVMHRCNLLEFPSASPESKVICADRHVFEEAAELIRSSGRITVKTGGGAARVSPDILSHFLELTDAVYVHGPQVPGLYPASAPRNMTVGGSKGSICGNYAMANCDLLIAVGARGVCQWDSSGTAFPKAKQILSINCDYEDLGQYNRSLRIQGDAECVLAALSGLLEETGRAHADPDWLESCRKKRAEWDAYRQLRFDHTAGGDQGGG